MAFSVKGLASTKSMYQFLRDERSDRWIVPLLLLLSLFTVYDLFSTSFSWELFHERDFGRAADFVLGKGLSHLGPEMIGGGNLPGPGLTLLFSFPLLLFRSPVGIHVLMQLMSVSAVGLVFVMVKRHQNRAIAYLSLAFILSASNYVFFAYVGWHAGFIAIFNILSLFFYDRYLLTNQIRYVVIAGIMMGWGVQIHMSMIALYPAYLLCLLFLNRRNLLKVVTFALLGTFATFSYYFYMDAQNGFTNSMAILGLLGEENLRNADLPFSLPNVLLNILDIYPQYASYTIVFVPAFFKAAGYLVRDYSGWLFLVWAFLGLCLIFYSEYENKKKTVLLVTVLLFIFAIPSFSRATVPRFYLIAHPAIEVMLAISTYLIVRKLRDYKVTRAAVMVGIGFVCALNVQQMISAKTVREAIKPPSLENTLKVQTVLSNNYHPYVAQKDYMETLVHTLAINPTLYRDRFYLYWGEDQKAFLQVFVNPTDSHYEMAYYAAYPDARDEPVEPGGDYGIILVWNEDLPKFNSQNLEILKTEDVGGLTAYYYEGPYFYRQEHQYNDYSPEEQEVSAREVDSVVSLKTANELYVDVVLEAPVEFKTLRYLQRLVLKPDSENGLQGYTEIVSADLRQSEWQWESPYFIKNPSVKLLFRDGSEMTVSMLEENLYSHVRRHGLGFENKIYENHGYTDEVRNLGNYYVPSPYGTSLSINSRTIADIEAVEFSNAGYGSIIPPDEVPFPWVTVDSQNMVMKVDL